MRRPRSCEEQERWAIHTFYTPYPGINGAMVSMSCFHIGMSYGQIAAAIGKSEQHVVDSKSPLSPSAPPNPTEHRCASSAVCTGAATPTTDEFNALARVLDITSAVRFPSSPYPPPTESFFLSPPNLSRTSR